MTVGSTGSGDHIKSYNFEELQQHAKASEALVKESTKISIGSASIRSNVFSAPVLIFGNPQKYLGGADKQINAMKAKFYEKKASFYEQLGSFYTEKMGHDKAPKWVKEQENLNRAQEMRFGQLSQMGGNSVEFSYTKAKTGTQAKGSEQKVTAEKRNAAEQNLDDAIRCIREYKKQAMIKNIQACIGKSSHANESPAKEQIKHSVTTETRASPLLFEDPGMKV